MPELSVIIVSYNVRQYLLDCLRSLEDNCRDIDHETIVIDNASNDGSSRAVEKFFPEIKLISNGRNLGFAAANNQGYRISKGEYILLLNPDTVVRPGAIQTVLQFIKDTLDAGLAACRLLNSDGSLQKSIMNMPSVKEYLTRALFIDRIFFDRHKRSTYYRKEPFTIGMAGGAFMLLRRTALSGDKIFKNSGFMYAEEPDVCIRLWESGWKVYFVPGCEIIHHGGRSSLGNEFKYFLELQRGIKYLFSIHWKGARGFAITTAYWLHLVSSTAASVIGIFTARGRRRLKLFLAAALRFPFLKTNYRQI
jgi:GT2 family glycosyltransferase